jgi:WW domain
MSSADSAEPSPRRDRDNHDDDDDDGQHTDDAPKHTDQVSTSKPPEEAAQPNNWQAIFSPHHNAYYFHNAVTQETTWENPLQPSQPSSSSSSSSSTSQTPAQNDEGKETDPSASTPAYTALQQAALSQGIDPSLAYLDPSLISDVNPTTGSSIPGVNPSFTAKFNARTGAFTRNDARDPSHLSEYERAKRMSEFYFDVEDWQSQRDAGGSKGDEEGKKRKRPTKKDLVGDFSSNRPLWHAFRIV